MGKPYEGTLAWKIPWMEKLVGYSLWWTAVYGVAKSWTRLHFHYEGGAVTLRKVGISKPIRL